MIRKLLVVLAIVSIAAPCFAQIVDTAWVRRYNGPTNREDIALAMAVDDSGYVYVTGFGQDNTGDMAFHDYTTIKYHSNGDTAWIRGYNGPGDSTDQAAAIAVDDSGNVYVTGQSYGTGWRGDYATVKYYPDGDTAWVRRYNGPGNDTDLATALAVDGSGNVCVTGYSVGSGSEWDYTTIKYEPNGDTAWARRYNGPGNYMDQAEAIAVDGSGNIYVTGGSHGSGTQKDYATIKYEPNGDTAWVRRYNGPGNFVDEASAIAVDGSGNVYVTGSSYGSGTISDYATIKYEPDGDTAWVRRYNGPGNGEDRPSAIAVDGSGNVYVTGYSIGSGTGLDYATIKYEPDGDTAWVRRYNGPGNHDDYGVAIAVDGSGNVYVTGPSVGSGISYDYATIKYKPNGDAAWVRRYEGPGSNYDQALGIAVDGSGNVYVTGGSVGAGTDWDYATIKYFQRYPPTADFVGNPVIGEKNLQVSFTDLSEGEVDSWYWSFGDGYFSLAQNPTHTYRVAGSYDVKLIATNQGGPDTLIKEDYIQVLAKPLADFAADPNAGSPPFGVQFTDNSIGNVTSWWWDFGDDSTSTEQNPFHQYNSLGTYDVTLISTSGNGSDTLKKEDFIIAYSPLSGDSVKILDLAVPPGQEDVVIPIIESNSDSLSAFVIPLTFGDTASVQIDSVSFVNGRASHFDYLGSEIYLEDAKIRMSGCGGPGSNLPIGQGLIAEIYLSVKDVTPLTTVIFDTTLIEPGCSLYFVDCQAIQIIPGFCAGTLLVEKSDTISPETPQNLTALPLESGISLTWDAVSDPDLRLYGIYRLSFKMLKPNVSFTAMVLDDTLATSLNPFYLDSDVSPGGTYFYWVSAVDSAWNESELSDLATASFGDTSAPVITLGPTVIAVTDSTGTIYWETDERADGCMELFEETEWVPADSHTTFLLEHTITLDGRIPSTSYEYRVRSDDSLGNGPTYSGTKSFTTASTPDVTPPQIIFGPAVVLKTHNSATIEWTTNEIANSRVYYGESTPFADSAVDPSFVTSHSITLASLSSETEYLYQVCCEDPSTNGPVYSDTLTFTTEVGPDTLPPAIVEGPIHSGITHNKAVISWLTDEISTSIVQYGPSQLYGSEKTKSDFVQSHQIVLTNLKESTLYHYRVGSVDPASNGPTWSSNFWFWTHPAPDTLSPIILAGPYASWVTNTMAQIAWTTDEISDSWVCYGLDLSYDKMAGSASYVKEHSIVLTNVLPDTTYYYYVSSTDPSGNSVESGHGGGGLRALDTGEDRFTTKASADVAAPVIVSGPHVRYKTHNMALVEWVTDETGNSIVEYGETQGYGRAITYPQATINHTAFLSNLSPNTTYHFRVGSEDIAKNGPTYSGDVTFTTSADVSDTEPPVITAAPEIAYADESRAVITWETDEPADSYMAYELIGTLAEKVVGESMSMLSHQLTLDLESSYNVRVSSSDQFGNGPTYSDYFTVTALAAPDVTAPVVISGPEVVYLSENSAKIRWETDELSSSFVEYGLSEEYTDIEGNPDNNSLHQVTLTNLTASTTYHYRVKSADLFGNIYFGPDSILVTQASSDTTAPSTPTGLSSSYGNQLAELSWNRNLEGDLSGYNLCRGTTISTLSLVASNLADTRYQDQGLTNGTTYYYQLTSRDQSGNESPASEMVCAKPLSYLLGDFNGDGAIGVLPDVVDVVAMVNYVFKGAEGYEPLEAGNVNCDADVDVVDIVYLVNYVFKSGEEPCNCTIPSPPLARLKERAKAILGLSFSIEVESEEAEVLLEADASQEVAGMELDLRFDPWQLELGEIKTTSRTEDLGLYYNLKPGKIKIGLVDVYGVHTMPSGKGSLLRIKFQKKRQEVDISSANIEKAILVDVSAQKFEVEILPNKATKSIPHTFSLAQNYPNPFNARTVINYSLPKDSEVRIDIYNILGQRVKTVVDEYQPAGYKTVVWDGTNQKGSAVGSGIYLYRIQAGDFTSSRKMLLLK